MWSTAWVRVSRAARVSPSRRSTCSALLRNITGARPERSVNFSTRLCFQSLTALAGSQPSPSPLLEAPTRSQAAADLLRAYT